MDKTIKRRVSKPNPLIWKPPPIDKRLELKLDISFYDVNDGYKYDKGDVASIIIKIIKEIPSTKKNFETDITHH